MKYKKIMHFVVVIFLVTLMLNISSATTYTGEGTYNVKQGDLITIGDYSVSVLSVDLDPRDDSWYQYTNQPRVYISTGGVGYVLHEGESANVLLNKVSDLYVMTLTAKEIDIDSGTALVYAKEYIYDYDPSATNPDTSNEQYTQYGPFNDLRSVQIGDDIFGFVYSNDKKNYNIKMNNNEYGPYSSVRDFSIAKDSFGFVYNSNSEDYVRINDNTYGPFKRVMGLSLSENNWAFTYENSSGSKFVQTKNSLLGPYDYLWSQLALVGNTLGYNYGNNGEYHVVVNGNSVGDRSAGVEVSESGKYTFCYFKNSQGYCNVNGKVYGPYGTGMMSLISDNHFLIKYEDKYEDGWKNYVVLDDETYGPYDYVSSFVISEDLYAFAYDNSGNSYMNINGKVHGPYDESRALANLILDEDNYAYSYRDDLILKTVVNGDALTCPQGNQVSSIDFSDEDFIFSCSSGSSYYVFIKTDEINVDTDEDNYAYSYRDDLCYPLGYRKNGEFCSDLGEFVTQLGSGNSCKNNFECESNICVSGECVSEGLMQKIINWFKKLFGYN